MAEFRMRPRFGIRASTTAQYAQQLVEKAVAERADLRFQGFRDHCVLSFVGPKQKIWSPQVSLDFREDPDRNETLILGRFEPQPSIWTLFIAIYGLSVFVVLVGGSWGLAQWLSDATPWAWISVPIGLWGASTAYLFSFVGRALGMEEMYIFARTIETALQTRIIAQD